MRVDLVNLLDINELMNVYKYARIRMIEEGNLTQWDNEVIFKEELIHYINQGVLYKVIKNNEIVGCFAYILGGDKAYNIINGKWLNNNEYITVHKIMSKYTKLGIGSFMINYVKQMMINDNLNDIKIDTHKNNKTMNKFLVNNGFKYCGTISLNGDFNDEYNLRNGYHFHISK